MTEIKRMNKDLGWEDVRLIVQGENSLIGFDEKRICFYRISSLKDFSSIDDLHFDQLSFEKHFSEPIFRLFLNEKEEILTLVNNENLYFLLLPKISSKKNLHCPLVKFVDEDFDVKRLVNFVWLTTKDFLLFSLCKCCSSMFQCDRYSIESKENQWKSIHQEQYLVERSKEENVFKLLPSSFDQRFQLIQIDSTRIQINGNEYLFIFLQKLNGDLHLLKLKLIFNEFQSKLKIEKNENEKFIGPIRFHSVQSDNYRSRTHSRRIHCSTIKSFDERIWILIENVNEIYSMILDEEENDQCSLLTLHRFLFSSSSSRLNDEERIESIHFDRISTRRFYLIDSSSNIYSIEYRSIDEFLRDGTSLCPTIDQIYSSEHFPFQFKFFSTIENHFNGFLFLIIDQTNSSNKKILHFVRRHRSLERRNVCSSTRPDENSRLRSSSNRNFSQRIEMILQSNENENSLEEKLFKEKKIREEFENKQKFLLDYFETQQHFEKDLNEYFQSIEEKFHLIIDKFDKEIRRHEILCQSTKQISIEKKNKSSFNEEFLRQIEIQINYLKTKIEQMEKIFKTNPTNRRTNELNDKSMKKIDEFINYYREEISTLKKKLKDLQTNEIN